MREIKFRGFDTESKEWLEPITCVELIQLGSHLSEDFTDEAAEHWKNKVILMQYTGLNDKDGKNIYEGDICANIASKWEVIFDRGCFSGRRIVGTDGTQNTHLALRAINELHIIGNIYQTPHLLK